MPSLLWFKVKEPAGSPTITDSVGGATATLAGGVAVVTDGTRGTALSFPGGVGQTTTYSGGGTPPLTLAAWVRPDTGDGTIRTTFGWSIESGLQFRLQHTGTPELLSENTASIGVATSAVVTDGVTWTRIVATYDPAGNFTFYLNGTAAGWGRTYKRWRHRR